MLVLLPFFTFALEFVWCELALTTIGKKYGTYVSVAVNEFTHSVDPSGQRIDGEHVTMVTIHYGVLGSVHICHVNIIQ